ncbi:glutathione S-transferase C-terminal domain-containing protein homolog [Leguminivora glycinivorella]|uniref:glutathione S-transferase C-terminal domain-containing protein homolog n=1 Tax=Leguminivora glycinivorella TaxID=1035111 RepID=UPI00200BA7C3|nr:glutathione S-transferase C-terminal domain-containing protein homolog [Leguminivora glycinivorella]
MDHIVYLEAYINKNDYQKGGCLKLPLESLITYCVYKFCCPKNIALTFVYVPRNPEKEEITVKLDEVNFTQDVIWQVSSCVYPVLINGDTVITGLCAVARHMSLHRTLPPSSHEHEHGILGFRRGCLQAPNEVSIWTKFCEVDLVKTTREILKLNSLQEVPVNLVRFENHLRKPIRVHNVFKLAREIKKKEFFQSQPNAQNQEKEESEMAKKERVAKARKWKSSVTKEFTIDSSVKIQDLDISHQFAEGPFLTLADIVLAPLYYIIVNAVGQKLESLLPLTSKWFQNVKQLPELETVFKILNSLENKKLIIEEVIIPAAEDVSLYKRDPNRNNPRKRMFTKPEDVENALSSLVASMHIDVDDKDFKNRIDWDTVPDGANPSAGHLPDERMTRKAQQLENLALAVKSIAKEGDLIVDFCSGSGHLGILIAHLLPQCTVILLENKEHSLLRARKRIHDMGLQNVYFFQCNLDFFIGKFDIGVGLHACGIASDLILDKCLKCNANFVLCPCCYGSLHATDRLVYPRSKMFSSLIIDQYLTIGHAADQTHKECPLTVRGDRCMAIIDSDRLRLAEEYGYKVTLSRLKPLSCTPKNNLLIGVSA